MVRTAPVLPVMYIRTSDIPSAGRRGVSILQTAGAFLMRKSSREILSVTAKANVPM